MSELHLVVVAGTRPKATKLGPLLPELNKRGVRLTYVWAGQHHNPAMAQVAYGAHADWYSPDMAPPWERLSGVSPMETAALPRPSPTGYGIAHERAHRCPG